MNHEIHLADWGIPYSESCEPESVATVLMGLTQAEHDWSDFPWQLAARLMDLTENPKDGFEYFHLTEFFKARAAMLVLKGHVLDRMSTFAAMSRHRMQIGGIYRRHVIRQVRMFLKEQGYSQLPECEIREVSRIMDGEHIPKRQMLVRELLGVAEREYLKTLTFISDASDLEDEFAGHSAGYWIKGAEMPKPVHVKARRRRHDGGHDIMPSREDIRRMFREGMTAQKIRYRLQAEFEIPAGKGLATGRTTPTIPKGTIPTGMMTRNGKAINLGRKHKTRAFLQFIQTKLRESRNPEFYVEEMREAFNSQFPESMTQRRWLSDRFREDLFRGKELEFDLLFESLDKMAGQYRIRT